MKKVTLAQALKSGACYTPEQIKTLFGRRKTLSAKQIAALDIPAADKVWALTRPAFLDTKEKAVRFAVFCAEQCVAEFEKAFPTDNRPRKAIDAANAWLATSDKNHTEAARAARAARAAAEAARVARAARAAWAAAEAAEAAEAARVAARAVWAAEAAEVARAAEAAWAAARAAWAAEAARAARAAWTAEAHAAAWAAARAAWAAWAARAAWAAQVEFLVKLLTEEK